MGSEKPTLLKSTQGSDAHGRTWLWGSKLWTWTFTLSSPSAQPTASGVTSSTFCLWAVVYTYPCHSEATRFWSMALFWPWVTDLLSIWNIFLAADFWSRPDQKQNSFFYTYSRAIHFSLSTASGPAPLTDGSSGGQTIESFLDHSGRICELSND